MKPVVNVKKFGNTATLYLQDIATEQPYSVRSWEDSPDDMFPQTLQVEELLNRYGDRYDFVFIERPQVELPTSKRARASTEMLEQVKKTGALPDSTPASSSGAPVPAAGSPVAAILRQMELMAVKLSVAEGRKLKELTADYLAVKKFIVRVMPELSPSIEKYEQENDL